MPAAATNSTSQTARSRFSRAVQFSAPVRPRTPRPSGRAMSSAIAAIAVQRRSTFSVPITSPTIAVTTSRRAQMYSARLSPRTHSPAMMVTHGAM